MIPLDKSTERLAFAAERSRPEISPCLMDNSFRQAMRQISGISSRSACCPAPETLLSEVPACPAAAAWTPLIAPVTDAAVPPSAMRPAIRSVIRFPMEIPFEKA